MPTCELCGREVSKTHRHHLIPKTRHANKRVRQSFSREDLHETIDLCAPCHKTVHAVISEKQLQRKYSTLESLKAHPDIAKFVAWVATRPHREGVYVDKYQQRES